jgi:hypothetical protein
MANVNTTYTQEQIRYKLATDERWVRRALIRLYERQTRQEQAAESTHNCNFRGFQPGDARWFSRIAQFCLKYPNRALSEKQLKVVRRPWRGSPAICKYAGQLMQIMQEDAANKCVVEAPKPIVTQCGVCGEHKPGCGCERKADVVILEQWQEMRAALSSMR